MGMAIGAITGAIAAQQRRDEYYSYSGPGYYGYSSGPGYSYGPGYYAPGYYDDQYYDGAVAVAPAGDDAVAYCMQTYRSYDVRSGTYLGNDGFRHPCP